MFDRVCRTKSRGGSSCFSSPSILSGVGSRWLELEVYLSTLVSYLNGGNILNHGLGGSELSLLFSPFYDFKERSRRSSRSW